MTKGRKDYGRICEGTLCPQAISDGVPTLVLSRSGISGMKTDKKIIPVSLAFSANDFGTPRHLFAR